jgi:hypothetical protein
VNLQDCLDLGLTTTQSTIDWWALQTDEARLAWKTPDAPQLVEALTKFCQWIRKDVSPNSSIIAPWGNGSDFDLPILGNAFAAVGADMPWKFWNHRCYRTIKNLFPVDMQRRGVHHNALDDAETQAVHLLDITKKYGINIF